MALNMCVFYRTFLVVLSILILFGKEVASDCYRTTTYEYRGHQQTTSDGQTCIRWDSLDHRYRDSEAFPEATTSEDENYCRDPGRNGHLWCYVSSSIIFQFCDIKKCVDQCGTLKIEQPTILGRNVTFTFTPETTSDADVKWQRANRHNPWSTLRNDKKFTQYFRDGTYYLILTNTVRVNDEVIYRVAYTNNSVSCLMETQNLELKDIGHSGICGFVYLRTTKVREGENVEIEYYPTRNVMNNPEFFKRKWTCIQNQTTSINLKKGVYDEEAGPNDKYVLTILMFKEHMNGQYGVNCGRVAGYSNMVQLILPVPPSAPVFEGLKDIDDCKGCIVGEDGDQFSVLCKTSGGTQLVVVTMSIGNESLSVAQYNATASHITFFTLRNRHHMTTMKCTVMNDVLASPLIITARVYVIKPPTIQPFAVPHTLKEGNVGNITCIVDGGRPVPNVTVTISGIETPSAVKLQSFNANTSLYTNVVSLATFERTWNKEHVKCCRFNECYKSKSVCSVQKRLNIIFPPTDIKLEVKVEQSPPHNMYAVCTIYDSNPACSANISAPNRIIGSERYSNTAGKAHGAWNSEHAVNLNVVKDDNGKKIECAAACENFSVDLKDVSPIILPHPPIIEFNIPGSDLTVFQGEQAFVKCSAKSIPASNISWMDGNVIIIQCWLQPIVLWLLKQIFRNNEICLARLII